MDYHPDLDPGYHRRGRFAEALRQLVTGAMDALQLDALIYPTWSNTQREWRPHCSPHDNSDRFSPATEFPAVAVPMGWLLDGSSRPE